MEKIDLILKLIPLLGFIPFMKAIWEYIKDVKWKKSEKNGKRHQNNRCSHSHRSDTHIGHRLRKGGVLSFPNTPSDKKREIH